MVWNMNRPELWIPFYASEATTDPLIYSLDYWEKNGEEAYAASPIGTGPWKHVSYQQGAKLRYERALTNTGASIRTSTPSPSSSLRKT